MSKVFSEEYLVRGDLEKFAAAWSWQSKTRDLQKIAKEVLRAKAAADLVDIAINDTIFGVLSNCRGYDVYKYDETNTVHLRVRWSEAEFALCCALRRYGVVNDNVVYHHHSACARGYSRVKDGLYLETYNGRFGRGFVRHMPSLHYYPTPSPSLSNHTIQYWVYV